MIHFVLLTRDDVGRSVIDSRVIDVDESDGLDTAGRVNAGIDLMLTAARDDGRRVGPIGVTARTGAQRRRLRSRGSGPRRQIRLVAEDEATLAYLAQTGQIDRFDSVVVADCGDTGMTLYTVEPASGRVTGIERSAAMSGRRLDRAIADKIVADAATDGARGRIRRSALLSACRTAKEEINYEQGADASSVSLAEGAGRLTLTAATVDDAAGEMVAEARKVLSRYLSEVSARGSEPDAVVLTGGLANLPVVRGIVDDESYEVVCPDTPELVAATGAALLAQQTRSSASRLAFIGGHRQREWLSATPIAVAGAVLAAALMTIYAVSSALTGQHTPEPAPAPLHSPVLTSPAGNSVPIPTTSTHTDPPPITTEVPRPQHTTVPDTGWNDPPGWATTELPETPSQSAPPSTRTLIPFPLPSLPFPEGSTPTIPPELIPPGLIPKSSTPPTPAPVPRLDAPNTRQLTPPPPALTDDVQPKKTPSGRAPSLTSPQPKSPPPTTPPTTTVPSR